MLLVALVAGGTVAAIETRAEGRVEAARGVSVRVNGDPVRLGSTRATLAIALARAGIDPHDGVLRSAGTATVLDTLYDPAVVTVDGIAVSMDARLRRHARIVVDNGIDAVEPTATRTLPIPYPNQDKVGQPGWIAGAEGEAEEVYGTVSGEVISRRVTREPVAAQQVVVPAAVSAGSSVFLTFDDGPDPTWTLRVLDVLRAAGIKATFCICLLYTSDAADE